VCFLAFSSLMLSINVGATSSYKLKMVGSVFCSDPVTSPVALIRTHLFSSLLEKDLEILSSIRELLF